MNAYYYYYCYYFLQIDTNYLYDNRSNRLIEINYLLAIIRFVFKYKEETEKAYLIQLPANVVCFLRKNNEKNTVSHSNDGINQMSRMLNAVLDVKRTKRI
jgi:hypothetical protein